MKKDKKFLNELETHLVGIKDSYKKEIIEKYDKLIKDEKAKKKKITSILKAIGSPEDVAKKELELLGNKGKLSLFDNIKNKYKDYQTNRKQKQEKKESDRLKKNGIKVSIKGNKNVKINKNKKNNEDFVKEKIVLRKNKEEVKNENLSFKDELNKLKDDLEEEPKEKSSVKEKLSKAKVWLTKDITFDKKDKPVKEKKVKKEKEEKVKNSKSLRDLLFSKKEKTAKERKVEETPSEIVKEVKEEFEEEISEVSQIVSEKHIFESKEKRRRRIILKTLGVILTVLLAFVWLWVCVIFIASIVAYLDGVKLIGLILGLFGLNVLVLWIVIMTNRAIFRHKMSLKLNLIVIFTSIFIIALGTVMFLKQIYALKPVKDVTIKYNMVTKLNNYELPEDKDKKFTITFNSNYKTQYTINYDNMIKDKVKVEVKYYECYYDYYVKNTINGAYMSLSYDDRDRLSIYIDDLKEGKIFDNDELARYSVKITVNPNDVDRLKILD